MTSKRLNRLPVEDLLEKMAESLKQKLCDEPLLVAIQTGGLWIAEYLHKKLEFKEPLGALDISFYRDDFSRIGLNPEVHSSHLPVEINNRHIILIDDVLHTGRTVRAALNELFAWGRPASVELAVLVDRTNRELPFYAQTVGHTLTLSDSEFIKISPDGVVTYSNLPENSDETSI